MTQLSSINVLSLFIIIQKRRFLNNLEFDHADIFDDLAAIQKQFHHPGSYYSQVKAVLLRQLPKLILMKYLEMGCWTPVIRTSLEAMKKRLCLPN